MLPENEIIWKFTGKGHIIGLPAKDLTQQEAKELLRSKTLVDMHWQDSEKISFLNRRIDFIMTQNGVYERYPAYVYDEEIQADSTIKRTKREGEK